MKEELTYTLELKDETGAVVSSVPFVVAVNSNISAGFGEAGYGTGGYGE